MRLGVRAMTRWRALWLFVACVVVFAEACIAAESKTEQKKTDEAGAAKSIRPVTYKGRLRSAEWFENMFKAHQDKIASLRDGRYLDISMSRLLKEIRCIAVMPPEPGYELRTLPETGGENCRIFQVISENEALLYRPAHIWHPFPNPLGMGVKYPEVFFHVKGLDTSRMVNDMPIPANNDWLLVYVGTYKYGTVIGSSNVIQSYVMYKPLSQEQFADALEKGFELKEYELQKVSSSVSPEMAAGIKDRWLKRNPRDRIIIFPSPYVTGRVLVHVVVERAIP